MSMVESQPLFNSPRLFVLMGVAGCGKSTIGAAVAEALDCIYMDGDDFHPQSNIEKMSKGIALTDEDRRPWLKNVATRLAALKGTALAGCSALKKDYRNCIAEHAGEPVQFIFLNGSRELILKRMSDREGHFMPVSLLDSQFATLQIPDETENAISVDIDASLSQVVSSIADHINTVQKKRSDK